MKKFFLIVYGIVMLITIVVSIYLYTQQDLVPTVEEESLIIPALEEVPAPTPEVFEPTPNVDTQIESGADVKL